MSARRTCPGSLSVFFRDQQVRQTEVAAGESCVPMTGLRIDEFYGHDDQIGPFARVLVKPSETVGKDVYPVVFEGSWQDASTGKHLTLRPKVAIVPVYHKIRVTFLDVQTWLTRLTSMLQLLFPPPLKLEWNLHLTTTNQYKQLLKTSALTKDLIEPLLLQQHPRFIWRALLTIEGQPVFELLADATDMARSFPIYRAIWHDANLKEAFSKIRSTAQGHPPLKEALTKMLSRPFYDFLCEHAALPSVGGV